MNYLIELLAFYDWLECNRIDTPAICLWHALMAINNKAGWREWFAAPMLTLELKTGLKRSAVYRARDRLVEAGRVQIRARTGQQCSLYRLHPFGERNAGRSRAAVRGAERAQPGTQAEHNPASFINQGKEKPDKRKANETRPCPGSDPAFDRFWLAYPRKTARRDALAVWRSLGPDAALEERILAALARQQESAQWRESGGRFIPYAASWLTGRRWEDEPETWVDKPKVIAQQYTQREYTSSELQALIEPI